jgi:hypothetical protein
MRGTGTQKCFFSLKVTVYIPGRMLSTAHQVTVITFGYLNNNIVIT